MPTNPPPRPAITSQRRVLSAILAKCRYGAGLSALLAFGKNDIFDFDDDNDPEIVAARCLYHQEWILWAEVTAGQPGWTSGWIDLIASRITGQMLARYPDIQLPAPIRARWDAAAQIDDSADDQAWQAAYAAWFSGGEKTTPPALPTHWRQILPLARPLDDLLISDGDSRLQPDAQGYSPYGLTPQPTDEACFSSTTATPINSTGYAAAAALRRRMIKMAVRQGYDQAFRRIASQQRRHLAAYAGATDAAVILCPSGTHAAMLPLFLQAPAPLTVILVGAVETGRGVPLAAAGRSFDPLGVDGGGQTMAQAVDEDLSRRTEVSDIPLRDARGHPRADAVLAEEIGTMIAGAVARRRRVLLYAVAGSKTGLRQPPLETLNRWRDRWPLALEVVIDACQMRLEPAMIATHLAHGHIVLLTGSKMATALPFCGAVLLPPAVAARHGSLPPLPAALGAHSNRAYWPDWPDFCAALPDHGQPGTLLRWQSGFAHLDPYMAMPDAARTLILRDLAAGMTRVFDRHPRCRLIGEGMRGGPERGDPVEPAVLSFQVRDRAGQMLDMATLRHVYQLLQRAEKPYHVGQPVLLASAGPDTDNVEIAAMRVAIDARMVHTIWNGHAGRSWGGNRDARLSWVLSRLSEALDAIGRIADEV